MLRIAIFASGSGSNAQNIVEYFQNSKLVEFPLILTNNPKAYVIERAKNLQIPTLIFTKNELNDTTAVLHILKENQIDWVVLAGFLLKIPKIFIETYPDRIINIHPALLPKFGGKGMYGDNVHKAVVEANEKESGITIHYVNEHYDEGAVIAQERCEVLPTDTAEDVANKVHALEYEFFPRVIEKLLVK